MSLRKTASDSQLRWAKCRFQVAQASGRALDRMLRPWGLQRREGELDNALRSRATRLLGLFDGPEPVEHTDRVASLALSFVLFVVAVALFGMLAGCTGGAVGVAVHDPRAEPLPLEPEGLPLPVVEACETWGVECEAADGPIVVWLLPDRSVEGLVELGRGLSADRCLWATASADLAVAHELGHAFGLEHVDDPANVMGDNGDPYLRLDVTAYQLEVAGRRAERYAGCP